MSSSFHWHLCLTPLIRQACACHAGCHMNMYFGRKNARPHSDLFYFLLEPRVFLAEGGRGMCAPAARRRKSPKPFWIRSVLEYCGIGNGPRRRLPVGGGGNSRAAIPRTPPDSAASATWSSSHTLLFPRPSLNPRPPRNSEGMGNWDSVGRNFRLRHQRLWLQGYPYNSSSRHKALAPTVVHLRPLPTLGGVTPAGPLGSHFESGS